MSTLKRALSPSPPPSLSTAADVRPPKRHRPLRSTPLTRLSDELLLRILSHLRIRDLVALQRVSKRLHRIATDGQIWKALYYRRYVLPRASRIPGLRSSREVRWLDDEAIARTVGTDWRRLYRLRWNWGRGACGVRTIDVAGGEQEGGDDDDDGGGERLLVKMFEGIVFTASLTNGLRAWRLRSADELIAHAPFHSEDDLISRAAAPTALAVDEESGGQRVNVTVGFSDGAFTMYQLDTTATTTDGLSIFRTRYVHGGGGGGGGAKVTAMAMLGPYLSTMTGQTWDIYDFSNSDLTDHLDNSFSSSWSSSPPSFRMIHPPQLHAPRSLASLRSETAWPPIALSLRRSVNGMLLASIVYAFPLYLAGWSVGMQELRFSTIVGENGGECSSEGNQTTLKESRIATAVPSGFAPAANLAGASSSGCVPGNGGEGQGGRGGGGGGGITDGGVARVGGSQGPAGSTVRSPSNDPPPLAQPTSMSYSHPYLLTSHADNTLTLYLVRSTASSLTIDPGQRLWGHTSAVTSAVVDGRGKAISINRNGSELRVWELESLAGGGVSERRLAHASVKVEPVVQSNDVVVNFESSTKTTAGGFDDEKVVVLKEEAASHSPFPMLAHGCSAEAETSTSAPVMANGKLALLVYDFTR